jgi:hypothetical protein
VVVLFCQHTFVNYCIVISIHRAVCWRMSDYHAFIPFHVIMSCHHVLPRKPMAYGDDKRPTRLMACTETPCQPVA